jgi:hypothetical protein
VDAGQLWPSFAATIAAVAVPAVAISVVTGIAIVPVTIPIAATGVAFT